MKILRAYKLVVLSWVLVLPSTVSAAKWTVTPSLNTSATYYDNITLSETNKNKELVTQIQPGVAVSATGRRLQLASNYLLGYVNYFGPEFSDRFFNTANASMDLEAIDRHLFISSTASISQQVIDPSTAGATVDPNVVSSNRTETRTWSVTPTLRNRFGYFANSMLSNQYNVIDYSSSAINSSWTNTLTYSLVSGNWFNRLTWLGNASYVSSEREETNTAQALGRINYALTDHWSVFTLGRVQKFNYSLAFTDSNRYFVNAEAGVVWTPSRKFQAEIGGGAVLNSSALSENRVESEQTTWRASVRLRPTSRTQLELGREQAAYGTKEYLTFNHYTRKTRWGTTYSETLITPQQSRLASLQGSGTSPGGVVPQSRAISNDVILNKRLDANASVSLRRVTLSANGYFETGEYQTRQESDERYGASGRGQLNIGPRTNFASSASAQRYFFESSNQTDNTYQFSASANRTLSKHINTSLIYIWQKRNSNTQVARYTSNQITAQVSIRF